jgi:hypothetical protein
MTHLTPIRDRYHPPKPVTLLAPGKKDSISKQTQFKFANLLKTKPHPSVPIRFALEKTKKNAQIFGKKWSNSDKNHYAARQVAEMHESYPLCFSHACGEPGRGIPEVPGSPREASRPPRR